MVTIPRFHGFSYTVEERHNSVEAQLHRDTRLGTIDNHDSSNALQHMQENHD